MKRSSPARSLPTRVAFATVLLIPVAIHTAARADEAREPVTIRVRGREVTGLVDRQTNDRDLWLRIEQPRFALSCSFAWSAIDSGRIGGRDYSTDELKLAAAQRKSAAAFGYARHDDWIAGEWPPLRHPSATAWPATAAGDLGRQFSRGVDARRIASLVVAARIANWDRDAQEDGIEVEVTPRGGTGVALPAGGQLVVALIARNHRLLTDEASFDELGRWARQLGEADFVHGTAVVRLPFSGRAPSSNTALHNTALVDVQFYATGQGRFDAQTRLWVRSSDTVYEELRRRSP